jgi:hypothetical protein
VTPDATRWHQMASSRFSHLRQLKNTSPLIPQWVQILASLSMKEKSPDNLYYKARAVYVDLSLSDLLAVHLSALHLDP